MMKKLVIASAIAMAMAAGSAMADMGDAGAQGQVQFLATVTNTTCDVVVDDAGSVNNLVQFGSVAKGQQAVKNFTMKLKDPACANSMSKAHFTWASSSFTDEGIKNQTGLSTDSWVKLTPVSGTNTPANTDDITGTNNAVYFTINDANDGFEYKAELHAGNVAGTFETAAAYTIVYE